MLNDKELAKVVKSGGKDMLFLEKYKEGFLVSEGHTIFYIMEGLCPKTFKELAGIFMGIPEKAGLRNGVRVDPPNMVKLFEVDSSDWQEVEKTDYLREIKTRHGGEVVGLGRILVNGSFTVWVNDKFISVANGHAIKAKSQNGPILLYNEQEELEGLILPIKGDLEPWQEKNFMELVGITPEEERGQSGNQEENVA